MFGVKSKREIKLNIVCENRQMIEIICTRLYSLIHTLNSAYNDCHPGTGVFQSLYPNIVIDENGYILASWPGP